MIKHLRFVFMAVMAIRFSYRFYLRLVTDARQHIIAGDFVQWKRSVIEQLGKRR